MIELVNQWTSLLLVFTATFYIAYQLLNRPAKPGDRRQPPGLPWLPVFGSLPFLMGNKNVADCFMRLSKRIGTVFSFYAGSRYVVVLNGYQAIHDALVSRGADFAGRCSFYTELHINPNRKGFGWRQYGEGYREDKQLTLQILKKFGYGKRVMETRIQREVEELVKYLRDTVRGEALEPFDVFTPAVSNVTLSIVFGRRFEMGDARLRSVIHDVENWSQNVLPVLDMFVVLRYVPYYRKRARFGQEAMTRNMTFFKSCMYDSFMSDSSTESLVRSFKEMKGPKFNEEDLLFIVRDLTTAGVDTAANTLAFCIALIANHRSVQDRLHAEIDSVVGRDRLPCLDDRKRLSYVEATILEVFRLKSISPFGLLHQTLCDTEVGGLFLPAETMVLANLYSARMDPDTWDQPELFRPERFLDDEGNLSALKDKVIPYSIGKRACIGKPLARQLLFLFASGILHQFDIRPPEGQERVEYDDKWDFIVSPTPYHVRFVARN